MLEAEYWKRRISELAHLRSDYVPVYLNSFSSSGSADCLEIGYYYDPETGLYQRYINGERGIQHMCDTAETEADMLKIIYKYMLDDVQNDMSRRKRGTPMSRGEKTEDLRAYIRSYMNQPGREIPFPEVANEWWREQIYDIFLRSMAFDLGGGQHNTWSSGTKDVISLRCDTSAAPYTWEETIKTVNSDEKTVLMQSDNKTDIMKDIYVRARIERAAKPDFMDERFEESSKKIRDVVSGKFPDISKDDLTAKLVDLRNFRLPIKDGDRFSDSRYLYYTIKDIILKPIRMPFSVSMPFICKEKGRFHFGFLITYYTEREANTMTIHGPSAWCTSDIETGRDIKVHYCEQMSGENGYKINLLHSHSYDKFTLRERDVWPMPEEITTYAYLLLDKIRVDICQCGKFLYTDYRKYMKLVMDNMPDVFCTFWQRISAGSNIYLTEDRTILDIRKDNGTLRWKDQNGNQYKISLGSGAYICTDTQILTLSEDCEKAVLYDQKANVAAELQKSDSVCLLRLEKHPDYGLTVIGSLKTGTEWEDMYLVYDGDTFQPKCPAR